MQRRRRTAQGADAWADVKGNAQAVECVKLFAHSAINAGVARVQPHRGLTRGFGRLDDIQHLFKRHPGAVMQLAVRARIGKQFGVDQ